MNDNSEYTRVRAWRESIKLSRRELSVLSGYSEQSIVAIERGEWRDGNPISESTIKTYKLCCASIDAGLDRIFNWKTLNKTENEQTLVILK